MTVMLAIFGSLPEVQFMHAICRFDAQEVNNLILQTACDSELKWRSYSHCKLITPSWRKNFAQRCEIILLLRNDFAAFLYSVVDFPLKFPVTLEAEHRKLKDHFAALRNQSFAAKWFRRPFCASAKWSLVLPDIYDRHLEIFFIRFLLSKSQNSPCKPPIIRFLSF